MWKRLSQKRWFSPLSARILAIMLLPLLLLLIGLVSVDQYRKVLVRAELEALERQGKTLARSLALADADYAPVARRRLAPRTLQHLLPLVGYGSTLRARVYQPDGQLIADTARNRQTGLAVRMRRFHDKDMPQRLRGHVSRWIGGVGRRLNAGERLPVFNDNRLVYAQQLPELEAALRGEGRRAVWRGPRGQLVLAVTVPIQDLRVVRGALLMTTSGGHIEGEIEQVQWAFLQVFALVLVVTIFLGLYLSRSITRPIRQLAVAAHDLRREKNGAKPLASLPLRHDEIGDLSTALREMTDDLQERIQATAGFAADVAHELKNPLTSLRSAIETVQIVNDDKRRAQLMQVILADITRLDRLITDISQASRVDAELAGPAPDLTDFTELVQNWVDISRDRHSALLIDWDGPEHPVMTKLHTSRIVQILDNLLDNARSFHPADKPVEVRMFVDADDAVLEIADAGPGIPPRNLETIFNRFYTERPASEDFGIHSGLGLSIARQIAVAHGGSLMARNRSAGGACFTLRLPLFNAGQVK